MVPYYGDFPEDATVRIPLNTFSSDDPAASVTATDLADADIKVHKDGSTTEIATDGATVSIDFDTITGGHMITIDTSAHADYSTGSDYQVRVEGVTVDAGTINAFIATFSIENRYYGNNIAATDIVSGGAITTSSGAVSNVTLVATTTTNTDMRGTDSAALATAVSALNDFNPATDTVANVTTVATTTTNTDMRGTDSAAVAGDAMALTASERTTVAASVAADILNDGDGTAVMQGIADVIAADWVAGDSSPLAIATAVWSYLKSAAITADSIGKHLVDELTSVRLATLTDLIDGGRLDSILDTIDSEVGQVLTDTSVTVPALVVARPTLAQIEAGLVGTIDTNVSALNDFNPATDAVDVDRILGTTIVETSAGNIAANFDEFFDNDDAITTKVVDDVGSGGGTVDANLTQILGTTIVETTSGNIGANFDEFFDNDDSLTTKVVDNVGAIAAGGDATEANQIAMLAALGNAALVQLNILTGGKIVLKQNDDHTIAAGNEILITQDDVGSALFDKMSVAGTTMQVGFRRKKGGAAGDITGTLVLANVSHALDITTMKVEVPAANTSGKEIGEYTYDIQLTTSGGDISTELTGPAVLTQDNI